MDAGQMILSATQGSSSAAAMTTDVATTLTPDRAGGFGDLLGQSLMALTDAEIPVSDPSQTNLLTGLGGKLMTGAVLTSDESQAILPTVLGGTLPKVETRNGETKAAITADAAKQQDDASTLMAEVQMAALFAQLATMQATPSMQVTPVIQTNSAISVTSAQAGTTGSLSSAAASVEVTTTEMNAGQEAISAALSTAQKGTAVSTAAVQNELSKTIAVPHQAVTSAEGNKQTVPVTAPAQQPLPSNPDLAPFNDNSQQTVLSQMLQNSSSTQAKALAGTVATAAPSDTGVQAALESQPLPPEITAGTRLSTASPVATAVRFAQPSDVVAATAGTGGQGGVSSQLAQQEGKQGTGLVNAEKVMAGQVESGTIEHQAEPVLQGRTSEHQTMAGPFEHRTVATDQPAVADQAKPVLAEQVTRQVAERLVNHDLKQGNDQISLKLSPENLGNIQVNLRMDDQRLKLEIVAENRGVRDALLQQAGDLKETLARQNIQMDSFTVTTGNNGSLSQQSQDWRQAAAEQRQQQPQYAMARSNTVAGGFEMPMNYFAPQYQSTIDVRF